MASYSSFAITVVWERSRDVVSSRKATKRSIASVRTNCETALALPGCLQTESLLLLNRNDIPANDELPQEVRPGERNL
jgi:hypothetical protein